MHSENVSPILIPLLAGSFLLGIVGALGGGCVGLQDYGNRSDTDGNDVSVTDGGRNVDATGDARVSSADDAGDGSTSADATDGSEVSSAQGACTAGATRCSPGNLVESCNAGGTAWVYDRTCASSCSNGACVGTCTPGTMQCNGNNSETCNTAGTSFVQTTTCTTFCSPLNGACALPSTQISTNTNMDGVIVVDGDFVVLPGATVTSPTGNLTIHAKTITVQQGGAIVIAPTGENPLGAGVSGPASYGSAGVTGDHYAGSVGAIYGSSTDSDVAQGASGGAFERVGGGGLGGGVLRLLASSSIDVAGHITADGQVLAPGAEGAGSGGGILLASDAIAVSGVVSAAGGYGQDIGGLGRVKLLYGSSITTTGTITGVLTQDIAPPIPITSTSHPDPTQIYNDNFSSFDFSWSPAFPTVMAYYVSAGTTVAVPTSSTGRYLNLDYISYPASMLVHDPTMDAGTMPVGPDGGVVPSGTFYFQAVSIAANSMISGVETVFAVNVNSTPPSVTSSSHPDPTAWSSNASPYFAWTFPVPDSMLTASYYLVDHYGDTVPDASATSLPLVEKNLQVSNLANGIWVFHLVTQDTRGYFTKVAGNYRVNIGPDPGEGTLTGTVVDDSSQPVAGATVSANRGIYTVTTNSSGTYNFGEIPVATWEVTATYGGKTATANAAVTSGATTTTNLSL